VSATWKSEQRRGQREQSDCRVSVPQRWADQAPRNARAFETMTVDTGRARCWDTFQSLTPCPAGEIYVEEAWLTCQLRLRMMERKIFSHGEAQADHPRAMRACQLVRDRVRWLIVNG
jgi:hypothetical protein